MGPLSTQNEEASRRQCADRVRETSAGFNPRDSDPEGNGLCRDRESERVLISCGLSSSPRWSYGKVGAAISHSWRVFLRTVVHQCLRGVLMSLKFLYLSMNELGRW
jgi:hypothetical protein